MKTRNKLFLISVFASVVFLGAVFLYTQADLYRFRRELDDFKIKTEMVRTVQTAVSTPSEIVIPALEYDEEIVDSVIDSEPEYEDAENEPPKASNAEAIARIDEMLAVLNAAKAEAEEVDESSRDLHELLKRYNRLINENPMELEDLESLLIDLERFYNKSF